MTTTPSDPTADVARNAKLLDLKGPNLLSLPPELKGLVVSALPDLDSVWNLALTCRALHDFTKREDAAISRSFILKEVGQQLLPLALARYEASKNDWGPAKGEKHPDGDDIPQQHEDLEGDESPREHNQYATRIKSFCEEYLGKEAGALVPTSEKPFATARDIHAFHVLASTTARYIIYRVLGYEKDKRALARMRPQQLTKYEAICYIFELVRILFPTGDIDFDRNRESPWGRFWLCFPSQENEYIRTLHQRIKLRTTAGIDSFASGELLNPPLYFDFDNESSTS